MGVKLPNFTFIGATIRVQDPKLKFLLRFYYILEYKRPRGMYPLRDFHEIFQILYLVLGCVNC